MAFTIEEEEILRLIMAETEIRMKINLQRETMAVEANPLQLALRSAQSDLKEKFKVEAVEISK